MQEEEEGAPRSTSTISVTGTYGMVPKVALILLPYVPTRTKLE